MGAALKAATKNNTLAHTLKEHGLSAAEAEEILANHQKAIAEADAILGALTKHLKSHEVPLLAFPEGLDHLIAETATGNRSALNARNLARLFPDNCLKPVENTLEGAEAEMGKALVAIEKEGEAVLKKSGKGKWIAGGVIAAVIAIGAFIATRKAPEPAQSEPARTR